MVNPLDCSSSWALTPVCTGRMGLGVGGAGVVGLTVGVVEGRVSLLELSVSLDLLQRYSQKKKTKHVSVKLTTFHINIDINRYTTPDVCIKRKRP